MSKINDGVLLVFLIADVIIATLTALFMGLMGTIFTDGDANPSFGLVLGLFTFVLLGFPAFICGHILNKRARKNDIAEGRG